MPAPNQTILDCTEDTQYLDAEGAREMEHEQCQQVTLDQRPYNTTKATKHHELLHDFPHQPHSQKSMLKENHARSRQPDTQNNCHRQQYNHQLHPVNTIA
jgi:hypothetical protein